MLQHKMPFVHVVLLPVRRDVPEEYVEQVVAELCELKNTIEFVRSARCGKTVTSRGKQFTHALVVELESADQLPRYQEHPAHQAVLAKIKKIVAEDTIAMDFDSEH
ncbi:hypothetical protein H4R26_004990 [Coemansia thaxteri]|uniref:Stress-response A/B barrel domain-containing protein n=1 Tax=Coemansia thaxteri TaxID=2663907 RepID=A0A9W8EG90_9FUNG|nr:hypothetical protein H4R26_004990 [Coemansia thaxteri]